MRARATVWNGRSNWRESLLGFRNKVIADPRFQRWAAASPLTRVIARRRARALFDLCAGFVYSQVLLACVRLRVCEHLAEGPRSTEALSRLLDLPADAVARLLRAAASLRLVRALPGDRYALDDLGASLLGNPSVAAFIEHHQLLYDDLRDPVALLRGETTTRLSQFWPYAGDAPGSRPFFLRDDATEATGSCAAYSELMSRSQALVANDILDAYPMDAHARLLDVGGGEGRFVSEAAARFSGLALTLFDLPPVVEQAKINLARRGITSRVELIGGSFLRDPLPTDADIISLVRIVHDHDDEAALALLRAAAKALPKGGTVLIAEPMAGTRGAEPIGDAYFGFYLLAMGRGRPRRPDELEKLMLQAGFTGIHAVSTRRPMLVRIMIGKKM